MMVLKYHLGPPVVALTYYYVFYRLPFPVIGIIGFTAGTSIDYKTWEILNASLALLLYINFLVDPLIYFLRTR